MFAAPAFVTIAHILTGVFAVCAVLISLFIGSLLYMVVLHRRLKAAGLAREAIQRTDRSGFKGGALQEGMERVPYEYFAIFDVDYVPAPDFLRRCMRPML